MFKKTRKVNKKLGKNQTKDHDKLYENVREKYGPTKICKGVSCIKHIHTVTGDQCKEELPIRDFPLQTSSSDGLQGRCRTCDRKYRKHRTNKAKKKNQGDVYNNYKNEYGTSTKRCSRCGEEKNIIEFNKSVGMECGLHNMCMSCSKTYGESVGDRWILYLPDGTFKYTKTAKNQHDDHIMPLAVGGSNEKQNHQLLMRKENLEKSDSIPYDNVCGIPENQISKRLRPILEKCKKMGDSIQEFKSKIRNAIYEEQTIRYNMSEEEHLQYLKDYNTKNNTNRNMKRAHKKFREFYESRYIKN